MCVLCSAEILMKLIQKIALLMYVMSFSGLSLGQTMSGSKNLPEFIKATVARHFPGFEEHTYPLIGDKYYFMRKDGLAPAFLRVEAGKVLALYTYGEKNPESRWEVLETGVRIANRTPVLMRDLYTYAFVNSNIGLKIGTPEKGKSIVVYSAYDCQDCIKFERALLDKGISYVVVPGYNGSVMPVDFKRIYCAPDKKVAWEFAMRARTIAKSDVRCRIPEDELKSIGFVIGSGVAPAAIFPDGRTLSGDALLSVAQKTKKVSPQ